MHRERFRRTKFLGLLSAAACVLLCILAVQSRLLNGQPGAGAPQASSAASAPGQEPEKAQTADSVATDDTDPDILAADNDDDGPSPGNFLGSTYVPSISAPDQPALAAAPPPPTPVPANAGEDAARQQINNETANLLAMAYALKAEVDKTNQDQLSISVVRKAVQIEQMARKVREELRPQQSRN